MAAAMPLFYVPAGVGMQKSVAIHTNLRYNKLLKI